MLSPDKAYSAVELVGDLQDGVFSELKGAEPKVEPLRRNLQRAYIDILKEEFDPTVVAPADAAGASPALRRGGAGGRRAAGVRAAGRGAGGAGEAGRSDIAAAVPKAKDTATKAHLMDSVAEIASILEAGKKK